MDKNTRKNIISTIITLLILFGGVMIFQKLASEKKSTIGTGYAKKERRKVEINIFNPSNQPNEIVVDGRVRAQERVNITSKVSGVLQEAPRKIREGMYFKKGDLLFTIDSREAGFDLKSRKSSFMTTITQMMPDFRFDYPDSYQTWLNYLNELDVDRPLKQLPSAKSDQEKYFVSGRNIQSQYYQIKSLESRLSEYNIYAPFNGVITQINVFPGTLVSPGSPLASMINTATYEVTASVPLSQLTTLKTGSNVELQSGDLDKVWKGRISRIGSQIDPTTQYVPVYISVGGAGLKDGMYLTGKVNGKSFEDVYKLPKSIFTSPSTVYIVQDSTLVSKEVVPVSRTQDHVLVKDLGANSKVVVGSLAGLFEGQKVNY